MSKIRIDSSKVETIEDVKLLLIGLDLHVDSSDVELIEKIKHLLADDE